MHEEEVLGKAYDGTLMRRMLKYLKPYRWYVAIGIALSIVVSAMEAVRPYFVKVAVDENIAHGDGHGLLTTTLLFLGLMIVRGIIQYLNTYLTQWIGQRTIFDLRMEIFEHLQRLGLKFYDRNPIGRLITRVTNDVEVLNDMFSSGIVMVFSDVFTIVGILYFMFTMNWKLAKFLQPRQPGTWRFRAVASAIFSPEEKESQPIPPCVSSAILASPQVF